MSLRRTQGYSRDLGAVSILVALGDVSSLLSLVTKVSGVTYHAHTVVKLEE